MPGMTVLGIAFFDTVSLTQFKSDRRKRNWTYLSIQPVDGGFYLLIFSDKPL